MDRVWGLSVLRSTWWAKLVTVASPMRIDRVAGSARATRSADQFPVIRRCGKGHGRQVPASVLDREIVERVYQGGLSQLRAYIPSLRSRLPSEPEVRFETALASSAMMDLETIHRAGWPPRSTNAVSASACASRRPATPASRECATSRDQTMTNGSSR